MSPAAHVRSRPLEASSHPSYPPTCGLDLALAVDSAKCLEQLLLTRFQVSGEGLGAKVHALQRAWPGMPNALKSSLHTVIRQRNDICHTAGTTALPDRAAFVRAAALSMTMLSPCEPDSYEAAMLTRFQDALGGAEARKGREAAAAFRELVSSERRNWEQRARAGVKVPAESAPLASWWERSGGMGLWALIIGVLLLLWGER